MCTTWAPTAFGPRELAYGLRTFQGKHDTSYFVNLCAFATPQALAKVDRRLEQYAKDFSDGFRFGTGARTALKSSKQQPNACWIRRKVNFLSCVSIFRVLFTFNLVMANDSCVCARTKQDGTVFLLSSLFMSMRRSKICSSQISVVSCHIAPCSRFYLKTLTCESSSIFLRSTMPLYLTMHFPCS